MDELSNREQAVELLQKLGLKEYESKVFVALAQLPKATAKEISDLSEVPRTRIYDAIRVLESKGLVETQHTNPQQFRAVATDEAVNILVNEYRSRTEHLRDALDGLEPISMEDETDVTHEVWALAGSGGIIERTASIIDEADSEVVLVLGHESVFTDDMRERLSDRLEAGIHVVVGCVSEELRQDVQAALPDSEVFVSELQWLASEQMDDTKIGRLLLVDKSTILVSTFRESDTDERMVEQAVFGRGFDNGLVTIVRRLMSSGLLQMNDPSQTTD